MTASEVLRSLEARGIKVWADGDKVQLTAERGLITDQDRDAIKSVKPSMLALLTRPAMGTIRCPRTVRGSRLVDCPFHTCGEKVERLRTSQIYECKKCGNYFELMPMEGVYFEPGNEASGDQRRGAEV